MAAFSPRTRDFFAAFGKFEGFERAAPVPAAAGHVPRAFPRAPAGRRGTGWGAGRTLRQAQQHKKSTGSFDSVLSCASMGMRAFASLPDVPRSNIVAHWAGVVNPLPASKGICQALAALQIPLTWYNLEPPVDRKPGARARQKGGRSPPPARPGLGGAADTSYRHPPHPRREKGEPAGARAAEGRPGAFVVEAVRLPAVARRATAPPRGSPEKPKGKRQTPTNWGVRATALQSGS